MPKQLRQVPEVAETLIKSHEKYVPFVYDDAYYPPRPAVVGHRVRGTLTAAWGHTKGLHAGMAFTQDEGELWFNQDLLEKSMVLVERIGQEIVDLLNNNQYAALIDFCFNTAAAPHYSIWDVLKAKQFDKVPAKLVLYNKGMRDGQLVVMDDLVKRRKEEVALWNTPIPKAAPSKPTPTPTPANTPTPTPQIAPVATPTPQVTTTPTPEAQPELPLNTIEPVQK